MQKKSIPADINNTHAQHTGHTHIPIQRTLKISGAINLNTSGLATLLSSTRQVHVDSMIGHGSTFSFSTAKEMLSYIDQQDIFLGNDLNPAGIREKMTLKVADLATLQNAVSNIVAKAVLTANRVALLNEVGEDIDLLSKLLNEVSLASMAGIPTLRLMRVFAANIGVRDLASLKASIAAQKKILRGEISGGSDVIGAHSPQMVNHSVFFIIANSNKGNNVQYVDFKKLIRPDTTFASDITKSVANNMLSKIDVATKVGILIAASPLDYTPQFSAYTPDRITLEKNRKQAVADIIAADQPVAAVKAAAIIAAAAPNDVTKLSDFIDKLEASCSIENKLCSDA
ncbi:MAG: hypothetical protein HRT71_04785 [Flavobacteriales bacterium]|nr:hypothetical protein [Flavobacteriales bacterium]